MNSKNIKPVYRGRFAPTPSGPLHFGSLMTAVGSYLQSKSQQGEWLLRIEDIDPPRVVPGATDKILHCLEKYGLYWDGPVLFQSARNKLFQEALDLLHQNGLVYACRCSRKTIAQARIGTNIDNDSHPVYPGTCRKAKHPINDSHALRVKTEHNVVQFDDLFFGEQTQNIGKEVGDFVVKRVDGFYAYHLAVVVDDFDQGISEIVRGYDLIDSTFRQIYLQELLGFHTPRYGHLPLIVDKQGAKLSKQLEQDLALLDCEPVPVLVRALRYLGQTVPDGLADADIDSFWQWAIKHWQADTVPANKNITYHIEI